MVNKTIVSSQCNQKIANIKSKFFGLVWLLAKLAKFFLLLMFVFFNIFQRMYSLSMAEK
jgi:hypothetical protein